MIYTLYHNPRCSKSRRTLEILQAHGVEPEIVEYLKTPPDEHTLTRILLMLGLGPRGILRKSEPEYAALGLSAAELSDAELIKAMVAHPILIERPIVVAGDKAVIGRPPENVEQLIPGT